MVYDLQLDELEFCAATPVRVLLTARKRDSTKRLYALNCLRQET